MRLSPDLRIDNFKWHKVGVMRHDALNALISQKEKMLFSKRNFTWTFHLNPCGIWRQTVTLKTHERSCQNAMAWTWHKVLALRQKGRQFEALSSGL